MNINTLYTFTNLNPKLIKGRFAGLLANEENDNDIIIEMNNTDNPVYSRYAIFETKKFGIKLSFLDLSSGTLYLLFKGYAAFLTDEFIKIYFFSHNNTSYDIFQKIYLPDELRNSVLFLFKYVHDDNFYFFNMFMMTIFIFLIKFFLCNKIIKFCYINIIKMKKKTKMIML